MPWTDLPSSCLSAGDNIQHVLHSEDLCWLFTYGFSLVMRPVFSRQDLASEGEGFYENQVIASSNPPGEIREIQRNSSIFFQVSWTTWSLYCWMYQALKKSKTTPI